MHSRLSRCLKSLESVGFLSSGHNASVFNLELMHHGSAFAQQLQQQWLNMRPLAAYLASVPATEPQNINSQYRSSFVHSRQFRKHLQQLRQLHPAKAKCPTLIKHEINSISNSKPVTQLITDFFVEAHRGLEHFYNVQRESKIWWMRYSSNPSRYAIKPYDMQSDLQIELEQSKNCPAIDIRADFGDDVNLTLEELSLVHLPDNEEFHLPDAHTGKMRLPAVIRSVIELEPATCALLLDGCDHGREGHSLLLNRVLAPYQCGIAGIQQTDQEGLTDLRDLCAHMADVLQRARLRLQMYEGNSYVVAKNNIQLANQLELSDCLGVPYTLILDEYQTLNNGLLQLRSRDTQLAETIHISDLPNYLLNIFRIY